MPVPNLDAIVNWSCRKCNTVAVTRRGETNRFHKCPGLHNMMAPLVPVNVRAKVVVHEREDYIGGEMVTRDDRGRPIMSVETIRDDGSNDVVVFAPCATTRAEGNSVN